MAATGTGKTALDCDVLIIGAGVGGLCALYQLRQRGFSVRVLERGGDVGGVWYWNRYPGARFDSESYTYCYSFSRELLDEWTWRERFAAQPEVLAYLNHVADRFDLRRDIDCHAQVVAARFLPQENCWQVETAAGTRLHARFLVTAVGPLSAAQWPDIEGIDSFAGEIYHTGRWPHRPVQLAGKRVGVIGTGATGVQVIQTIAAEVAQLTVFQRTPTYCIPQRNGPLTEAEWRRIRRDYPDILDRCRNSYGGFIHDFDPRIGRELSAAARQAKFEELWQQPGFAFWFSNFSDLMMDPVVNEHACEFLRDKIRQRVRDPEVANRLMPDHPFGAKRVPLESGYYEAYNRDNVELVDLRQTPIEIINCAGVRTSAGHYPLDILICATGYDAVTGALLQFDICGLDGLKLAQKWRDGPVSCLGLMVAGFPNLFTLAGPLNAASLCNAVRCTEQNVDWIADCLVHLRDRGLIRIDASAEAEAAWTAHVHETAAMTLLDTMTDSWYYGANTPGKPRSIAIYAGGAKAYREHCDAVAEAGYPGFDFT